MNPKRVLPVVLILAVGAWAAWHFLLRAENDPNRLVASGTVEATDAQLGFPVAGRIVAVDRHEGERVSAGDEIAHLDAAETETRRDQAAAAVDVARAQLAELESGFRSEEVAQARAQLAAAGERVDDAVRDLGRVQTLFDGKAVSRESLDKAKLAVELARAQRDQASEQLTLLERGQRRERIEGARAQLSAARAALATLEINLSHLTIRAPFGGVISVRHREAGEVVPAGAAVVTLLDPADRWVRIYVPENRLGAVHLGLPAEITSDTYPDKRYRGEVSFIASEAEFTPKNVQTAEERVRLVYAVKIRIDGDEAQELKPGLPADVAIELRGAS